MDTYHSRTIKQTDMKRCAHCNEFVDKLWRSKPPVCMKYSCRGKDTQARQKSRSEGTKIGNKTMYSWDKYKKRKTTGELALFNEIWNERPHVSEVSGVPLGAFDIRLFSHICTKQSYPSYRLRKDNIKLVTKEEHDLWEFHRHKIKDNPKWEWVFEKYQELVYEYYNGVNNL